MGSRSQIRQTYAIYTSNELEKRRFVGQTKRPVFEESFCGRDEMAVSKCLSNYDEPGMTRWKRPSPVF